MSSHTVHQGLCVWKTPGKQWHEQTHRQGEKVTPRGPGDGWGFPMSFHPGRGCCRAEKGSHPHGMSPSPPLHLGLRRGVLTSGNTDECQVKGAEDWHLLQETGARGWGGREQGCAHGRMATLTLGGEPPTFSAVCATLL